MRTEHAILFSICLIMGFLADHSNAFCQTNGKDETAAKRESVDYKTPVREIIVICKTHFDLGYTRRVGDIVQYYRTKMIDDALSTMDSSKSLPKNEQFRWTAPGWVMYKIMEDWKGQSPQRRQRLDEAFRSGKFVTHAMPFTLESDACEPEAMARGFYYSVALNRKYHFPTPNSAKVTDVPSHSPALETVLANGGIKFLHIGCNWPSGYVRTPGLFWWVGPDGSRTLTLYSSFYGTCIGVCNKDWPSLDEHFSLTGVNLIPPGDWKYDIWPAIIVTADNSGPPNAEQIKTVFDEVARKLPGVKVRMGTLDDFANAILAEHLELPVVKGNMPDTWIHGIMSDPGGTKLSRNIQPLLTGSEILHTQLNSWGIRHVPLIADSVAVAYEKINLYGEHTWGGAPSIDEYGDAFKKIPPEKYADLEASWEDKTDYIRAAARITKKIEADNLRLLAQNAKHDKPAVIVYNPLPWKRSGVVEIDGQKIFARDVPSCGYKIFPVGATASNENGAASTGNRAVSNENGQASGNNSIENEYFKITIDPARASIISLFDKKNHREWVDGSSAYGLGQYLNERFTYEQTLKYLEDYQGGRGWHAFGDSGVWRCWPLYKSNMISETKVPYRAAHSANGHLTITRDALTQTVLLEMPGDTANHLPATSLRVSLGNKGQDFVELEITIRDKAKDNWPEADWLCLPFKIDHPRFNVDRPLGGMNPVTDILTGANRYMYSVGHGVTLTDADGQGIAICPIDHPLISIDTPGIWKYSMDYVPKKPVVFLNLYNNQWNTNFRYWYPGTWSSRVRISMFNDKTPKDAVIADGALEARYPLEAVVAERNSTGILPSQQAGIQLSRKGVVVTAFGNDMYGNKGTLLRVWEQAGVSGMLTVTLPEGIHAAEATGMHAAEAAGMHITEATPVNLRGEKTGSPIKIINNRFSFELKAYAPASFIVR